MKPSGLKMAMFLLLVLLVVPCLCYGQVDTGLGGCCGAPDPNYSVVKAPPGVPLGPARSAGPPYPGWKTGGPDWINPWGNPSVFGPPGTTTTPYDYQTTFSLASSIEVDGEMAADNGACLLANNVSISCTPLVYGFKNYVDFTIPAANLNPGLNTLDFNVNNISGPTALSVHFYIGCLQPNSVYTNLPANGTVNAWTINFGFAVSDNVTTSEGTIDHFCFYLWAPSGSTPVSAEVSVTSSEFGGTSYFDENVTLTCTSYCKAGYPMHGGVCGGTSGSYDVWACTTQSDPFDIFSGTWWINVQNAVSSTGDAVYWDQAGGNGCPGTACPSLASQDELGTIPSESFFVYKP